MRGLWSPSHPEMSTCPSNDCGLIPWSITCRTLHGVIGLGAFSAAQTCAAYAIHSCLCDSRKAHLIWSWNSKAKFKVVKLPMCWWGISRSPKEHSNGENLWSYIAIYKYRLGWRAASCQFPVVRNFEMALGLKRDSMLAYFLDWVLIEPHKPVRAQRK